MRNYWPEESITFAYVHKVLWANNNVRPKNQYSGKWAVSRILGHILMWTVGKERGKAKVSKWFFCNPGILDSPS